MSTPSSKKQMRDNCSSQSPTENKDLAGPQCHIDQELVTAVQGSLQRLAIDVVESVNTIESSHEPILSEILQLATSL